MSTVDSLLATLDDAREHRRQRWRGANNLLEHRGFVDFFAQGDVFLLEPLLGALAIVDIGTGDIPAR